MSETAIMPAMRSLAHSVDARPEVLDRVARWAVRCKDDHTMVTLLERDDLPESIDQLLADVPAVRVRTAWVRRVGRSTCDIVNLVAAETREKVLTAFAGTEGLPDEVYRTVAARAKGCGPLYQLLVGSFVPDDVRRDVAARLSKQVKRLTAGQEASLKAIVEDDAMIRDVVLVDTTCAPLALAALRAAGSDKLPAGAVANVLQVVVTSAVADDLSAIAAGRPVRTSTYDLNRIITVLERLALEDPGLGGFRDKVVEDLLYVVEHVNIKDRWADEMRERLAGVLADVTLSGVSPAKVREWATSGDRAKFQSAVDVVTSHVGYAHHEAVRQLATALAVSLVDSPLATGSVLEQLVQVTGVRHAASRRGGLSVQDAVICVGPRPRHLDAVVAIEHCVDPHAAVSLLLADEEAVSNGLLTYVLCDGRLVADDQLGQVPARVLTWHSPRDGVTELAGRCCSWILDRVGDDPVRWRVFTELVEGFSGSLSDLVGVVDISC
jgi:hypothetical protein